MNAALLHRYYYSQGEASAASIAAAYASRVAADGGITESLSCVQERVKFLKSLGLWKDVSLALIFSGYAEEKLYSVKGPDFGFSRASTRTRIGPEGLVEDVPYNLVSNSRGNFSSWTKLQSSNLSINDNSVIAPDGSLTASRLTTTVDTGTCGVRSVLPISSVGVFTVSFWARSDSASLLSSDITDVGGGQNFETTLTTEWTKYKYTATDTDTQQAFVDIVFKSISAVGENIDLWDVQVTAVGERDYFNATDRNNVPALDYGSGDCPVLSLNPNRTNMFKNSTGLAGGGWSDSGTVTITENATLGPDGKTTASRLESTGTSTHYQSAVLTEGSQYTISCYIKAASAGTDNTFRLFANSSQTSSDFTATADWQRFEFTITALATGVSAGITRPSTRADMDIYVANIQIEPGSYATSYIPTGSATASRIQDYFVTDQIGPLINLKEKGSIFCDVDTYADGTNKSLGFNGGNNDDRFRFYFNSSNTLQIINNINGSLAQTITTSKTYSTGERLRILLSWNGTDAKVFCNGENIASVSDFVLPENLTYFANANNQVPNLLWFGNIYQFFIGDFVSDEQAIALTTPREWYVRPAGGSYGNENGKSYDNAFDGFANIDWDAIPEGSTLYVDGTHNELLTVGKSNITVKSYNPASPAVVDSEDTREIGIDINGKKVTLVGISSINATEVCLMIQGDSVVTTKDCIISGSGDQGIQHLNSCIAVHNNLTGTDCADEVISGHDSSTIIIDGGSFSDNGAAFNVVQSSNLTVKGDVTYSNNTNDVLVNGGTSAGSVSATLEGQTFTSNVVANTGGNITLDNCVVPVLSVLFTTYKSTVIVNNSVVDSFAVKDGSDVVFNSSLIKTTTDIDGYCEFNSSRVDAIIDLSNSSGTFKSRHSFFYHTSTALFIRFRSGSSIDIAYCIFYGATGSGNYLMRIDSGVTIDSWNNNVFISEAKQNAGINVFMDATLTNSIFYNLTSAIVPNTGVTVESVNNCYYSNNNDSAGTGTVNETNKVTGDPAFTDIENGDYSLGEGSSCIGTGANLGSTFLASIDTAVWGDGDNVPVVTTANQSENWNIGAYV